MQTRGIFPRDSAESWALRFQHQSTVGFKLASAPSFHTHLLLCGII